MVVDPLGGRPLVGFVGTEPPLPRDPREVLRAVGQQHDGVALKHVRDLPDGAARQAGGVRRGGELPTQEV